MKELYLDSHDNILFSIQFIYYRNLYKSLLKKVDDELILDLRQDLFWIRTVNGLDSDINNSVKLKMEK